jgi:hypothetical protein
MSFHMRLDKLERRQGGLGYCHACGHHCRDVCECVEVVVPGRGEPTGHWFEQDGKRYRYTVDPRPSCHACRCPQGKLVLVAFYGDPPPDLEKFLVCDAAPALGLGPDPVLVLGLNLNGSAGRLPANCRRTTTSQEKNHNDGHEP